MGCKVQRLFGRTYMEHPVIWIQLSKIGVCMGGFIILYLEGRKLQIVIALGNTFRLVV